MFDTYVTRLGGSSNYHTHTITEKRAPTDESVRLLKEFEKAAQDKVIDALRVSSTNFDCVIHRTKEYLHLKDVFIVHMKVNGEKLSVRCEFDEIDDKENVATSIRDEVAKEIAKKILSDAFSKMRAW